MEKRLKVALSCRARLNLSVSCPKDPLGGMIRRRQTLDLSITQLVSGSRGREKRSTQNGFGKFDCNWFDMIIVKVNCILNPEKVLATSRDFTD